MIPPAIDRYRRESRRLLEVLDGRLAGQRIPRRRLFDRRHRQLGVGPWVQWPGVTIDGLDHLQRWLEVVGKRPAVVRGKDIPERTDIEEMIRKADESTAKVRGILA